MASNLSLSALISHIEENRANLAVLLIMVFATLLLLPLPWSIFEGTGYADSFYILLVGSRMLFSPLLMTGGGIFLLRDSEPVYKIIGAFSIIIAITWTLYLYVFIGDS